MVCDVECDGHALLFFFAVSRSSCLGATDGHLHKVRDAYHSSGGQCKGFTLNIYSQTWRFVLIDSCGGEGVRKAAFEGCAMWPCDECGDSEKSIVTPDPLAGLGRMILRRSGDRQRERGLEATPLLCFWFDVFFDAK